MAWVVDGDGEVEGDVEVTFSHVGICVGDLDRSLAFYCEGLGFELVQSHTVGPEFGPLMEIDDVALQSRFVRRDGVSIELLHFDSPGHCGQAVRRPMNQLGLTHLSLRVADVDAVARARRVVGGRRHLGHPDHVRFHRTADALDFVYCTDPDGTRVELMHLPG